MFEPGDLVQHKTTKEKAVIIKNIMIIEISI